MTTHELFTQVYKRVMDKYKIVDPETPREDGKIVFVNKNGVPFIVTAVEFGGPSIVIEYGDNISTPEWAYEDGTMRHYKNHENIEKFVEVLFNEIDNES